MLGPLLDRIEIINVPAYLPIEKMNIAKKYLIPGFEEEYGFKEASEKVSITDASLIQIINNYCGYEAGVRNLRKCLDRVFRKIVAKLEQQKVEEEVDQSKIPEDQPSEVKEEETVADSMLATPEEDIK